MKRPSDPVHTLQSLPIRGRSVLQDPAAGTTERFDADVINALRNVMTPAGAVCFDGTGGRHITRDTGMTFGANDPLCISFFLEVPVANPAATIGIGGFSNTAGNVFVGGAVSMQISAAGELIVRLCGATNADRRNLIIGSFVANYGGTMPWIFWDVRAGKVYANCTELAVAETTNGAPPAWTAAITGSIYTIGVSDPGNPFIGCISRWALWNLQLTTADRLETFLRGGVPPSRYEWGNHTNLITVANNTTFDTGTNIISQHGNTTVSWDAGNQRTNIVTNAGGSGNAYIHAPGGALNNKLGRAYRIKFDSVLNSGAATFGLMFGGNLQGTTTAVVNGANRLDVLLPRDASYFVNAGGVGWTSPGGASDFTVDNLQIMQLGAFVFLPMDEGIGFQFHDLSTNELDGLGTTTGWTHTLPQRTGYVRGSVTWTNTHESKSVFGQRCFPNGFVLTNPLTTKSTANSSGTGLQIGDANNAGRFVASNTFTQAKKAHNALASGVNPTAGGITDNDCNLTLDPDSANFTGTIEVEAHYAVTKGT